MKMIVAIGLEWVMLDSTFSGTYKFHSKSQHSMTDPEVASRSNVVEVLLFVEGHNYVVLRASEHCEVLTPPDAKKGSFLYLNSPWIEYL